MDSSVLLARYLVEERADRAQALLQESEALVTSRITGIEVKRGLGLISSPVERTLVRATFGQEWQAMNLIDVDPALIDLAATFATDTHVRSLDAIHIATALVAGAERFLTFDRRQASAARELDMAVVGD